MGRTLSHGKRTVKQSGPLRGTGRSPFLEIPGQYEGRAFFRIGEVSQVVRVQPHVLRYWESEFSLVAPIKSKTGERSYRRKDVESLLMIRQLLYVERLTIEGARKKIKEMSRPNRETQLLRIASDLVSLSQTPLTSLFQW